MTVEQYLELFDAGKYVSVQAVRGAGVRMGLVFPRGFTVCGWPIVPMPLPPDKNVEQAAHRANPVPSVSVIGKSAIKGRPDFRMSVRLSDLVKMIPRPQQLIYETIVAMPTPQMGVGLPAPDAYTTIGRTAALLMAVFGSSAQPAPQPQAQAPIHSDPCTIAVNW